MNKCSSVTDSSSSLSHRQTTEHFWVLYDCWCYGIYIYIYIYIHTYIHTYIHMYTSHLSLVHISTMCFTHAQHLTVTGYSWYTKAENTLRKKRKPLILTSLCFHTCWRIPCGYTLESSRWSTSPYRRLAAPGPGHRLGSAVSGSAGPRWMTRRCWWGLGQWSCSPPGRWYCLGNSWAYTWYSGCSPLH